MKLKKVNPAGKKSGRTVVTVVIVAILAFLYYYAKLPAFNIHAAGFWGFLILTAIVLVLALCIIPAAKRSPHGSETEIHIDWKNEKPAKIGVVIVLCLIGFFAVGSILSSPIVNAKKYQQLLTVKQGKFTKDIQEIDMNKIPLMDRDSATLLGNRKMGSMADMVSQFEVSDEYSQINYKNTPVRVSPLQYANVIKWMTNQSSGIPAYIKIDMATQDTELVKLDKPIRYSKAEHFNRKIERHLRFRYPTYIFDKANFEIDDNGTPWWICPVKDYTIGLFGGETISRVVLCNAQTGETQDLAVKDVPQWVDKVYSADMLNGFYNYYGTLKHGYFNSVLGQKDCLKTTDGYNYLALNDDVWVYSGVTSVTGDQSIVGFVLMNQRTKETKFYSVSGAVENSAMGSAEGQVQNLGYKATFPLLLNTAEQPTYFIALKDAAGLVKKYAMVNVQKYQIVAIGDTVPECSQNYKTLLKKNKITSGSTQQEGVKTASGKIQKISQTVQDGNSHYYVMLEGDSHLYDVSIADHIEFLRYNTGDSIKLSYTDGTPACPVTKVG